MDRTHLKCLRLAFLKALLVLPDLPDQLDQVDRPDLPEMTVQMVVLGLPALLGRQVLREVMVLLLDLELLLLQQDQ